ncbi:pentapeptide repeat-containing protein [Bradyrhizobium sp. LMTR 3]|uniref:pentapeptide repeat-containing protein n=1 Tax=Bradyrhizobium sp. LMTR 3 TaxID=189873 RepID=UPI000810CCFB|nr:pentapeptide repeat-containing protein [Bradyrhizobium sp. LMTR 3]OCK59155.1 hypothetical protein LMTR3_06125 [Bradyrhizobium sp. LMTR 3]
MTMTANETQPYASLKVLEDASDALIADLPEDELSVSDSDCEAIAERIAHFIDRATMTGTVLDAPDDRKAAQALVDFWLAKSYAIPRESRTKQRSSIRANTLLRPFDLAAVTVTVAEGKKVLASLSRKDDDESKSFLRQILLRVAPSLNDHVAGYYDLAKRMLLRTVRMSEGDRTCKPVAVKRNDLLLLGERAKEVLDTLITSGVLRVEPKESGDLISLRYGAMIREWDALRALIGRRVAFRDAVMVWAQRARAKGALIPVSLADQALADYADLSALERDFIAASSSHSRRKIIALAIVCAVAIGMLGYVLDHLLYLKREADSEALARVAVSEDDPRREEAIRTLALYGKPLRFQSHNLKNLDLNRIYAGSKPPAIAEFFKSAIFRVNFTSATLPYASFSQNYIRDVKFRGANLTAARFDQAVITQTDFSGATLYRAIFDNAQFDDVNFSNTDLRSTSFRNVGINGELTFTGTAWWLAFGWTLPQFEKLAARYGDPNMKEAEIFKEDIKSRMAEVDKASVPVWRVQALNDVAWTYTIYGADREMAREYAQKALDELKTIPENRKAWIDDNRANFTDTIAYTFLQERQPARAVKLLEQPGILETLRGDLIFRYAVALHALALEKNGDEKKELDQKALTHLEFSLRDRNYVPSHELYLLRHYIMDKDEFKAKLATLLNQEAN